MTRQGIRIGGLLSFVVLALACTWQQRAERAAEAVARPAAAAAAAAVEAPRPAEPLAAPVLRAEFVAPNLVLSGRVPDATLRNAIIERAQTLYGRAQVSDRIEIVPVARPQWLAAAFPPDLRDTRRATAMLQDGRLLVEGETASDSARARVDALLHAFTAQGLGLDVRLNSGVVVTPASEVDELLAQRGIEFAPGGNTITPSGAGTLELLVPLLQREAPARFEIAGHTDNLGDAQTNLALSRARAAAVRDALGQHGLDPKRFDVAGYGDQRPVADNTTPQGRQRNRRIEINLLP